MRSVGGEDEEEEVGVVEPVRVMIGVGVCGLLLLATL